MPRASSRGGEVRDPAALATALNELFEGSGLPRRGVRLGLANTRIGVRVIDIPNISDAKQLENAIGFRAHEILSAPLEEAVLDHHVIETETNDEGETTYKVLLVIAFRDSVDRYLAATDAANLEVSGIDLEAFALLRAALDPAAREATAGTATVAASIDYDLTTLAISDGSTCQFTRVLEWGAGNVDHGLVRTLKVTAAEAAELRSKVSLATPPQVGSPTGAPSPPDPADIVRHELQTLARELQSSIRFYGSQPGAPPSPRACRLGIARRHPRLRRPAGLLPRPDGQCSRPLCPGRARPRRDPTQQLERPPRRRRPRDRGLR